MTDDLEKGDLEAVDVDNDVDAEITDQDLDFDDSDNLDDADTETNDDETDADDDAEAEADDTAEDDADEEADDVLVTLDGGEQIPLSDLKLGYLRQQDYTHKTMQAAEATKAADKAKETFEARAHEAETTLNKVLSFVGNLIPDEPDLALLQTDPNAYNYQLAMRQAVEKELMGLVEIGEEIQAKGQEFSAEDMREQWEKSNAELVKAMPHLSDPARRHAFDEANRKTAAEFGFSPEEIEGTHDHRVLRMVHYARIGMRAEHNRNNAKRRVETPKSAKAKGKPVSPSARQNKNAMQRLSKSGSLEDALAVDFD